jgi:hypothetical protein
VHWRNGCRLRALSHAIAMTAAHPTVRISLIDMREPVNGWGGVGKTRTPHAPSLPSCLLPLTEIDAQDMGTHKWHDPQLMGARRTISYPSRED